MESNLNELFTEQIDLGTSAYQNLTSTYREMQQLINRLSTGTRKQMEIISEVEEGFDNDGEDSLMVLTNEISVLLAAFNEDIDEDILLFRNCITDSVNHFRKALNYYSGEESEKQELAKVQKTLLFLSTLIEKFKGKVTGISNRLKVLPAFTKNMKELKKVFRKEVKMLLVELSSAETLCRSTAILIKKQV